MIARGDNRSPATSTLADAPSMPTLAGAPVRTDPPARSMNVRAGSAYIMCSGFAGRIITDDFGSGPNISASTRANGGAAASFTG